MRSCVVALRPKRTTRPIRREMYPPLAKGDHLSRPARRSGEKGRLTTCSKARGRSNWRFPFRFRKKKQGKPDPCKLLKLPFGRVSGRKKGSLAFTRTRCCSPAWQRLHRIVAPENAPSSSPNGEKKKKGGGGGCVGGGGGGGGGGGKFCVMARKDLQITSIASEKKKKTVNSTP